MSRKIERILPSPTPFQRAKEWAHWSEWDVFGDWMEGMPNWSIEPHEDGTITASDGRGTRIDLGTWEVDAENNLKIQVEHDYPVKGL